MHGHMNVKYENESIGTGDFLTSWRTDSFLRASLHGINCFTSTPRSAKYVSTEKTVCTFRLFHDRCIFSPSHLPWFCHCNTVWTIVTIMTLFEAHIFSLDSGLRYLHLVLFLSCVFHAYAMSLRNRGCRGERLSKVGLMQITLNVWILHCHHKICLRNIPANRAVDIISVCVGSGMW